VKALGRDARALTSSAVYYDCRHRCSLFSIKASTFLSFLSRRAAAVQQSLLSIATKHILHNWGGSAHL
jgi:hypothetical protein